MVWCVCVCRMLGDVAIENDDVVASLNAALRAASERARARVCLSDTQTTSTTTAHNLFDANVLVALLQLFTNRKVFLEMVSTFLRTNYGNSSVIDRIIGNPINCILCQCSPVATVTAANARIDIRVEARSISQWLRFGGILQIFCI